VCIALGYLFLAVKWNTESPLVSGPVKRGSALRSRATRAMSSQQPRLRYFAANRPLNNCLRLQYIRRRFLEHTCFSGDQTNVRPPRSGALLITPCSHCHYWPQRRLQTSAACKHAQEESEHSQIMKTMHMLTYVYGPRLTGSPNHKRAAEWAIKQMTTWGLKNAHLDPWDFGHVGWLNERHNRLTVISPVKDPLVCEYCHGRRAPQTGAGKSLIQLNLPERPPRSS